MKSKDRQEADPWNDAVHRLRWWAGFLRRRGWGIAGLALLCAGIAALLLTFVYPKTYSARAVLAVNADRGTSVAGLLRLPETGYRRLAVSPEVLDRLGERADGEISRNAGRDLRIRLLNSREVRQEGVARLLELTAQAPDPTAAAELANLWGQVLVEIEAERAEAAGRAALEQSLRERQVRQGRRLREHRVRLRVAEEAAREHPGSRATERVEEARLQLRTEEALFEEAGIDLERLRPPGAGPASGEAVATAVAVSTLSDARLEEVLDLLETARGSLSVFLPAHPQERTRGVFLRSMLAGLGGAILGFFLAGIRELSSS